MHIFSDVSNNNNRNDEMNEPPPTYEAPPNYDEIIKVGMDEQMNRINRERRLGKKSRLQRPRLHNLF